MWLTIVGIVPAETESIVDKIKLFCILWQETVVDLHTSKKEKYQQCSLIKITIDIADNQKYHGGLSLVL